MSTSKPNIVPNATWGLSSSVGIPLPNPLPNVSIGINWTPAPTLPTGGQYSISASVGIAGMSASMTKDLNPAGNEAFQYMSERCH